ncbi:MAG: tetratricopeptide repeat protein [Candidatus Omnitrophica bacterium]|nr:tetratricopeptide repeat protein [Candidatus Omnitrophota bacterium]
MIRKISLLAALTLSFFRSPAGWADPIDLQSRERVLAAYAGANRADARRQIDQYLADHPADADIWGLSGDLYSDGGDAKSAEKSYRRALALRPESPWWRFSLARLAAASGKWKTARGHLEKLVSLHPELLRPRAELCGIYMRQGTFRKCSELLRGFAPGGVEDVEFALVAAAYYMKIRRHRTAARWIDRALALAPDEPEIRNLRYVNQMHLGRIVLDEIRKRERGVKSSLAEHYRKAMILMESGNMLQAKEKIRWLSRYYPEDLDLKLMSAVIEGELGRLDEAVRALEDLSHQKTDKITVLEMAQEMHREYVEQRKFEQRFRAADWEAAEEVETRYFKIRSNVRWTYAEEFPDIFDQYAERLFRELAPLTGPVAIKKKCRLLIYADKESFVREAYDYLFSDAVFFAGVYAGERNSIYYHFNKELMAAGVVHEIAHWALHNATENLPSWLDEGISDYLGMKIAGQDLLEKRLEEKRYLEQLRRFGNWPELELIVALRDYSARSYLLWRTAARFMFEFENGKYLPPLKKYLELLDTEKFEKDPFREAFAGVWQSLQKDWNSFTE